VLRICKKWNITGPMPLKDPGEGLRQRTQSQITSSLNAREGERKEWTYHVTLRKSAVLSCEVSG